MSNYPAVNGEPVTEAHTRTCAERGHARHVVDGVDQGVCPRCGALSAPALREDTLYIAFDRIVCGRIHCAGSTAYHTGMTIGGATVVPMDALDMALNVVWDLPVVCQCRAVDRTDEAKSLPPSLIEQARVLDGTL